MEKAVVCFLGYTNFVLKTLMPMLMFKIKTTRMWYIYERNPNSLVLMVVTFCS